MEKIGSVTPTPGFPAIAICQAISGNHLLKICWIFYLHNCRLGFSVVYVQLSQTIQLTNALVLLTKLYEINLIESIYIKTNATLLI